MIITLTSWLARMNTRLAGDFDAFEVYLFEGTQAELEPQISAWSRPLGLTINSVDVAHLVKDAVNKDEASALVDRHLQELSAVPGRMLVVVSGLHLLAWLFPDAVLQPIYARLRGASRVVLLVVPPMPSVSIPERAMLDDWRTTVRSSILGAGLDAIVAGGGIVR